VWRRAGARRAACIAYLLDVVLVSGVVGVRPRVLDPLSDGHHEVLRRFAGGDGQLLARRIVRAAPILVAAAADAALARHALDPRGLIANREIELVDRLRSEERR